MITENYGIIGKLPGFYRGAGITRESNIADDDVIQIAISDEWHYGDLLIVYGNKKDKWPLCVVMPDDGESAPIPFKIEKFNTQTGEFEYFDHLNATIELAEKGIIDVSQKWLKDTKKMISRMREKA